MFKCLLAFTSSRLGSCTAPSRLPPHNTWLCGQRYSLFPTKCCKFFYSFFKKTSPNPETSWKPSFWGEGLKDGPNKRPTPETHPLPLPFGDLCHDSAMPSREGWGRSFIISCLRVFVLSLKKTRKLIPFDDVLPSKVSSNGLQSIIKWTSIYHQMKVKTS